MDTLLTLPTAASRLLATVAVLLAYALLCAAVAHRHRRRRTIMQRAGGGGCPVVDVPGQPGAVLSGQIRSAIQVVYASQQGQAQTLAWHTAQVLQRGGHPAQVLPLGALNFIDAPLPAGPLLFVVSTHGEGDPPDAALDFVRRHLRPGTQVPLAPLRYGLLALGDRDYRHFCGFGRLLDEWLQTHGAHPLFPRIEVHRSDPASLAAWQARLAGLTGAARSPVSPAGQNEPDSRADAVVVQTDESGLASGVPFEPWQLLHRQWLNPGSPGAGMFLLRLGPPPGALRRWQAGDLVQIEPPGPPGGRPRDYSAASLPGPDGTLELLVRQHSLPDGGSGLVSGWLTVRAAPGDTVNLRVRPNPGFQVGPWAGRPLILIGNGTGLAGLRAHLQARAQDPVSPGLPSVWLVYGERSREHDQPLADELADWQARGVLSRLDRTFSRDEPHAPYVQHRLLAEAQTLRHWVHTAGAALFICGSRHGMAAGVDAALRQVLGDDGVETLWRQGRILRDVY